MIAQKKFIRVSGYQAFDSPPENIRNKCKKKINKSDKFFFKPARFISFMAIFFKYRMSKSDREEVFFFDRITG